jgi:hypothetical protein
MNAVAEAGHEIGTRLFAREPDRDDARAANGGARQIYRLGDGAFRQAPNRICRVYAAVKQAMQARSRRTGITADRVLIELAELAFSNIFDFIEVQRDGSVHLDLSRATRDRAAAVHDVVVTAPAEGSADGEPKVKVTQITLADKLKALEMLARHLAGCTGPRSGEAFIRKKFG